MKHLSFRILALLLLAALLLPMAAGCKKSSPTVGENGNWLIDGVDSGMPTEGPVGADGKTRVQITVGENGNWFLDGADSGIKAAPASGVNGQRVTVGVNGNWFIDGADTAIASGKSPEDVVLRFVAASDVHFVDTYCERDELLQKLYEQAYAYSTAQSYPSLDGVFFAGDIANTGSVTSFERFFAAVKTHTKSGTLSIAAMGNHEFFGNGNAIADFVKASGYASSDHHVTLSGYHIILLSPDGNGSGFSAAKQQWLDAELQKAAADDPTGKKPIFVFQHQHVEDTVYGSASSWGIDDLRAVLNKYPQVVDFSGHSHFPINDPRSIWQGEFTALNTASLKGLEVDIVGVQEDLIFPSDEEGGWSGDSIRADGGQFYIVEVTAKNEIYIRAFDIRTATMVGEMIYIPSVGDTASFTYTDARKDTETLPAFPADTKIEQMSLRATRARFRFTQAEGTYVQHYRCELYLGENRKATVYRLACGFLFPEPEYIALPLAGLLAGRTYTVKIYPVTAWGNEGEPLVFSFTTLAEDIQYGELLFSAEFAEGNVATETVTNSVLSSNGTPKTVYDEALGQYVAEFDGKSAFIYHDFVDRYSYFRKSVTFETFIKLNAIPTEDYVNPFSNQEGGGIGYELKADGRLQIYVNVNGSYQNVTITDFAVGEWMHLAATFDGEVIVLYVNGVEVGRTVAVGEITRPSAFQLVLGGDTHGTSGSSNHAECTIAAANVYRVAYDAETIAEMAAAYLG